MYFINEFIDEFFRNGDAFDITIGILMIVVIVVLAGVLILLIFSAVDTIGVPLVKRYGIVINRMYSPAHTTMVTTRVGNSTTVTPVHHPDSWTLTVKIKDESDSFGVSKKIYEAATINSRIPVWCGKGRITGSLTINRIWTGNVK